METSKATAMHALTKLRSWQDGLYHWVTWDEQDQTYVGFSPDECELCRDIDPSRFLQIFREASREWAEQQG